MPAEACWTGRQRYLSNPTMRLFSPLCFSARPPVFGATKQLDIELEMVRTLTLWALVPPFSWGTWVYITTVFMIKHHKGVITPGGRAWGCRIFGLLAQEETTLEPQFSDIISFRYHQNIIVVVLKFGGFTTTPSPHCSLSQPYWFSLKLEVGVGGVISPFSSGRKHSRTSLGSQNVP